jgi:hypothetical protein
MYFNKTTLETLEGVNKQKEEYLGLKKGNNHSLVSINSSSDS